MGRYTSNDNRSMQCNPNNERYYSSRGFNNDDDDDDCSVFNQDTWEKALQLKYQEDKDIIDSTAFNIFGKKVVFCDSDNNQSFLTCTSEHLFKIVLKETGSLKAFRFENYKGLTTSFKSFQTFLESYLDYDTLKKEQIKLDENIALLEERYSLWKNSRDDKEATKLIRAKQTHSFNFLERILKTDNFINKTLKRKYIFFNSVCISDNYMIFKISRSSGMQGRYFPGCPPTWFFSLSSYDPCNQKQPEVLYENFEDVFTCKKYLFDL